MQHNTYSFMVSIRAVFVRVVKRYGLTIRRKCVHFELELELIQTQMAQKPVLRAEVGMRVRCANKASAE
jgi:hypothetical protein